MDWGHTPSYQGDNRTEAASNCGARSCAIATHVFPKQTYDLSNAENLKGQLLALGRQLAGN